MKELIEQKLKGIEESLKIYFDFINTPTVAPKDRSVVSFKLMNEMIAFETLKELVPEYKMSLNTGTVLAMGLGGVSGYVGIIDGQVAISKEYDAMLANKEAYLAEKIKFEKEKLKMN